MTEQAGGRQAAGTGLGTDILTPTPSSRRRAGEDGVGGMVEVWPRGEHIYGSKLCPSAGLGEAMWPKIPGRKTVGRPTGRRSRWDWPGSSWVPAVGWSEGPESHR